MKISVYGLGYVGLTTVACSIKTGHVVHGVDVNADKVDTLRGGVCPIHEPGLEDEIRVGLGSKSLTLDVRVCDELDDSDIAMVCVGTPSQNDGSHNMTYIIEVTRQISRQLSSRPQSNGRLTLAYRSTMKPGSIEKLILPVIEQHVPNHREFLDLVYHPEFLRESTAIKDYFNPPKIVYGTIDSSKNPTLEKLYAGIDAPRFSTHYAEAEMTKFVDNSFHGLKVAFANEIGRVAYLHGISASKIHEIFVSDTKLNISPYYLRPGGAFGGSCLPKDIRALSYLAGTVQADTSIIDSLIESNEAHKDFLYDIAVKDLPEKSKILLNGLAFKADSDDMRESPLMDLAASLIKNGYDLIVYEPNFKAEALHAANLNHALTNLPSINTVVKTELADIQNQEFELLIDGRGNGNTLGASASRVFDVSTLP